MAEYSRRNGNRAASQRLGYLIELLDLKAEKAIDILLQSISNRMLRLITLSELKGRYIDRWKVIVNVPDDELSQWKGNKR
jgi:predicted transcriptional regulator of viral defense system